MKRRSIAGGKAGKSARHKTATLKRRDKPKAAREHSRSMADLQDELDRRTRERDEAIEQQTATSEVLRVVSSSPGHLQSVFATILENAVRICEAKFGALYLNEGDGFRATAMHNAPPAYAEARAGLVHPPPSSSLWRAATTKQAAQVADVMSERGYVEGDPFVVSAVALGGYRSVFSVPMLHEDKLIGVITIFRQDVRPFTDKQIALVQYFANQAVIAIENARLLNELRQRTTDLTERTADLTEALEQQTATSEVLQVISSSAGDLQPVFAAMLEKAVRICDAGFGNIYRWDGQELHLVATHNTPPAFAEIRAHVPYRPRPEVPIGRMVATKSVVHVTDLKEEKAYFELSIPATVAAVELGGIRTFLAVPMLTEGELVGAIMLNRPEVRPFSDKEIGLVTNFAAQAVIAIENARLLNELRQRTRDLTRSLEDLRTTQDRLVQTQKLASLGQLTAGIAHEIKNPLNFVNNFSGVSVELIDELREALQRVQADDRTRSEIGELADALRANLGKIVQHGQRADAIVKNMLQHSREGSGEHRPVDINAIVEEALNLAYHGARAEKQDFVITLQRSFDPEAGQADVFPQDITRVLLNLISNGFYAATKRKATIGSEGFQPTVAAVTRSLGDRVEIGIRDNGSGIPPEVKEKMFNPFFTTKPAGEGTGLGLSISYDIVVKQHAGSIEVDTQPGEFTEIRIILPRSTAHLSGQQAL
jgi:signal transduction histidine kinase